MNAVITTFTKRRINPLWVQPDDVCIEDIAHHLSCINRFNGALAEPVSVAQHSVYVARIAAALFSYHDGRIASPVFPVEFTPDHPECCRVALQGLLHDGGEAYCGDMTKWLKESEEMAAFRQAEARAQIAVYTCFNLPFHMLPEVEEADKLMVRYEAQMSEIQLVHPDYGPCSFREHRIVGHWEPWHWRRAEQEFLELFHSLSNVLN